MNDTLKLLYDRFYTALSMAEVEQEIEIRHRRLIERLEKREKIGSADYLFSIRNNSY